MILANFSRSRWSEPARPTYWILLGGTAAAAIIDLYPRHSMALLSLITTITYGGSALIVSIVAKSVGRRLLLVALAPGLLLALLPYAFVQGPVRTLRYLDPFGWVDAAILTIALIAILVGSLIAERISPAQPADQGKKTSPEKERFQREKFDKIRQSGLSYPKLADRLEEMIKYAVGRVDYYEDLRHRHLTIGLGILTGATAIGGFLLRFTSEVPASTALLLGVAALFLLGTGTWLIYYYNHTSSPTYVYRAVADIRSWYYAYNLPKGTSKVLSPDPQIAATQLAAVQSNFGRFLDRWLEWAKNDEAFLAEDLEQVFILQFIQGYKNEAVRSMQRGLVIGLYGFSGTILLALISWVVGAF